MHSIVALAVILVASGDLPPEPRLLSQSKDMTPITEMVAPVPAVSPPVQVEPPKVEAAPEPSEPSGPQVQPKPTKKLSWWGRLKRGLYSVAPGHPANIEYGRWIPPCYGYDGPAPYGTGGNASFNNHFMLIESGNGIWQGF